MCQSHAPRAASYAAVYSNAPYGSEASRDHRKFAWFSLDMIIINTMMAPTKPYVSLKVGPACRWDLSSGLLAPSQPACRPAPPEP